MAIAGRRAFLKGIAGAAAIAGARRADAWPTPPVPLRPEPDLAARFPDLGRHFAFEYYPWYGGPPHYAHWRDAGRRPPHDLATRYLPRLGPYDSRSRRVLEQHARWIRDSGLGAIALSWWGRGSAEDRAVHDVMDVFRDHDLKVTFGLEPYAGDRGARFADDVLFLLREYGEKRRFDALLLPRDEDGRAGPVLKGFRTIVPDAEADCRGREARVGDHTPDDVWRTQLDRVRDALRGSFDRVTLLADSVHFARTPASGFDGIGLYDNYIGPEHYPTIAQAATDAGLLFALNVNPGYDQVEPRDVPAEDECYRPRPLAPAGSYDWTRADERDHAAASSAQRIRDSFAATVAVQSDPRFTNRRRGFFFVYVNSFNEWHEGHAFEPMKDAADLTADERLSSYRNPTRGGYRLEVLTELMADLRTAR
jgi:hypothetical protein